MNRPGTARAFSLVELLVSLAVVALIFSFAFAAYGRVAQAAAISTGADRIADQLRRAREEAVAQNTTVEVRIYTHTTATSATPAYGVLQLHWLKSDGTTPAIAPPLLLPDAVSIDATTDHSPLIAVNTQIVPTDPTDPRLTGDTKVFHFLPSGATDLDASAHWFMTVRAANQNDPARFPANWAALALDPVTGRVQIYRP